MSKEYPATRVRRHKWTVKAMADDAMDRDVVVENKD